MEAKFGQNHTNRLVALDIGAKKICTLIANVSREGEIDAVGLGAVASQGVQKGMVTDIKQATSAILKSVQAAEKMADTIVDAVYVGVAGSHISTTGWHGVAHIENPRQGVGVADIKRAIETSSMLPITPDKEILDVVVQEFAVDGHRGIRNPIGMSGQRLEAYSQVVAGQSSCIRNITKCVSNLDIAVKGIALNPMASAEAVLEEDEKDLGAAYLDIGAGSTDMAVYRKGSMIRTRTFPLGGNHIDNDLAILLSVSLSEAERLKIRHGHAMLDGIDEGEPVNADQLGREDRLQLCRGQICEIIQPRVVELFTMVMDDIEENAATEGIPSVFVLTGGGALLQGMCEAGRRIMNRHVRLGIPKADSTSAKMVQNPAFAASVGIVRRAWAIQERERLLVEADGARIASFALKVARNVSGIFRFRQAY